MADKKLSAARKTAYLSMLCAAAIIFSYAETLVPISIIPLPGFRIGFANIVIVLTLLLFGTRAAYLVAAVRTVIVSLLFSSLNAAIFSLCGVLLSIAVMSLLLRCRIFSIYGISAAGAAAHNVGQLIAAAAVAGLRPALFYLPYLMLCAVLTGSAIAFILSLLLRWRSLSLHLQ